MIYLLALLASINSFALSDFKKAKEKLPFIFQNEPLTLYCGCRFSQGKVDLASCGYVPVKKNSKRARRIEWEHVVPAHAFGQSFTEWRQGGVKCVYKKKKFKGRKCARTNPLFRKMEGDLYNLYPEIGELNQLRSNYSMAELGKPTKGSITFGTCLAHIRDRKFEPMDRAKGIVARIYMYMEKTYPGHGIISDKNEKLFLAWDKMYPVTSTECDRGQKIKQITGRVNSVLEESCSKLKRP